MIMKNAVVTNNFLSCWSK